MNFTRFEQDANKRGLADSQDGESAGQDRQLPQIALRKGGAGADELSADSAVVAMGTRVLNQARVAAALHMARRAQKWTLAAEVALSSWRDGGAEGHE